MKSLGVLLKTAGAIFIFSILTACGGGGGGGDGDGGSGSGDGSGDGGGIIGLRLSPSSLVFDASRNGVIPNSKNVSIDISGTNATQILVGWPNDAGFNIPSWISLSQSDFTTNSETSFTLRVRINTTNLSVGNHTTRLRVVTGDSEGNSVDQKDIAITYSITPQQILSASPGSLVFSGLEGVNLTDQLITLTDSTGGIGNLNWSSQITYSSGANWLNITRNSDNSTFNVAVTPLVPGTYNAFINISYGASGLLTIPVSYTSASIATIPNNGITFTAIEASLASAQNMTVSFAGASNPAWNASVSYISGNGWLSLTQNAGSVDLQPSILAEGVYRANITISYTTSAGTSSYVVPVTYNVTKGVTISSNTLNFNAVEGEDPSATNITLGYSGTGTITSWSSSTSYTSGSDWLSVTPSSGNTLPAIISVDPSGLAFGTYNATIDINYVFGSITGTRTISVSYTVNRAITANPSEVTISSIESEDPAAIDLNVTYAGSSVASTWEAAIDFVDSTPTPWLTLSKTSGTTLPTTISVDALPQKIGTYRANIVFSYVINSVPSSITIPVTYTVINGLSVTPKGLLFTGVESKIPAAQTVTLGNTSTAAIPWTSSANSIFTLTPSSGANFNETVNIQPNVAMAKQNSNYLVNFYHALGRKWVSVNFQITTAWETPIPSSVSFNIDSSTDISAVVQNVIIDDVFTDGTKITWSASSNAPWLKVTPETGDTESSNTIAISLVANEAAALKATNSTTVVLTADNPLIQPLEIPVTVTADLPLVHFVAPYIGMLNAPNDVIVRGTGFNAITTENVLFGTTPAVAVNVVSDTEITVTPPTLTEGIYEVKLDSDTSGQYSKAEYHVVDTSVLSYSNNAVTTGNKAKVVFDNQRSTIYIANTGADLIERFRYNSTTSSWEKDSLAISPQLQSIALSPDGKRLVAVSRYIVFDINPDTFAIIRQETRGWSTYGDNPIADGITFGNNGKALISTGYLGKGNSAFWLYDILDNSFVASYPLYPTNDALFIEASVAASGDGSVFYLTESSSPNQPVRTIKTSEMSVTANALLEKGTIVTNRDGSVVVISSASIYDGLLTTSLGSLSGGSAAVISADGLTIYLYKYDASATVKSSIAKYERTAGGQFSETLPATSITDSLGSTVSMTMSYDEQTLIIAGDDGMVVMPTP